MPDDKNLQKDVLIDDDRLIHDYPDEEQPEEGVEDSVYEEKEKLDKETQKELKKRVDAVDKEINNAETPKPEVKDGEGKKAKIDGYNTPVVKIGEKLILPEPSDVLNEDVPKDIIRDYKTHYDPNTSPVDFHRSEFEEITPEEAIKLVKAGEMDKVMLLISGKAVRIDPNKSGSSDWRNYYLPADKTYYKKSGQPLTDTAYIGYKHLIAVADKIYKYNEVLKDSDVLSDRRNNPESEYYNVGDEVRNGRNTTFSTKKNARQYNPNARYGQAWRLDRRKQSLKDRIANLQDWIDAHPDNCQVQKAQLADYKRQIKDIERERREVFRSPEGRNDAAALRNYSSQKDLGRTREEYAQAKKDIATGETKISNALRDLNQAKSQGSVQTIRTRRRIAELESNLKYILRELTTANMALDTADENDAKAVADAQATYDKAVQTFNDAQDTLKRLLGKKSESLLTGRKLTLPEE